MSIKRRDKKVIIRVDYIDEEIHEHEKAAEIIKRYEDFIKTKRKGL